MSDEIDQEKSLDGCFLTVDEIALLSAAALKVLAIYRIQAGTGSVGMMHVFFEMFYDMPYSQITAGTKELRARGYIVDTDKHGPNRFLLKPIRQFLAREP